MKILKIILLVVFLAVIGSSCAADPLRQAEADRIVIEANNEADMRTERQKQVFAEDNMALQTKMQTDLIDAQTKARVAPLMIAGFVVLGLGTLACVTILIMFNIHRKSIQPGQMVELPRVPAPVYVVTSDGRYIPLPKLENHPILTEVKYEVKNDDY